MTAVRLFARYVGTFVPMALYLSLCSRWRYAADAIPQALCVTVVVTAAYVALARGLGELKQFDVGFLVMFAIGALAASTGVTPVLTLYQKYSPVLLLATLGVTAVVPLLLGREPFTVAVARRRVPAWKARLPSFYAINRVMTGYWALLFFSAAALAAVSPYEWRLTLLVLNVGVFGLGLPAMAWLPPLYLKPFPAPLPDRVEAMILGMPAVFDARAADDAQATIQFRVSGAEPGDYYVRIEGGRCRSHEGVAARADLGISTPDSIWRGIVGGEIDPAEALMQGLYSAEGDLALLVELRRWFPARRGAG